MGGDPLQRVRRVPAVLVPVRRVDLVIERVFAVEQRHVPLDAAGRDARLAAGLSTSVPSGARPVDRADVQVIAQGDVPDRHRISERPVAPAGREPQFVRSRNRGQLVVCPPHGSGRPDPEQRLDRAPLVHRRVRFRDPVQIGCEVEDAAWVDPAPP